MILVDEKYWAYADVVIAKTNPSATDRTRVSLNTKPLLLHYHLKRQYKGLDDFNLGHNITTFDLV